ncbi:MAG: hypothetical protein II297_03930, partial [Clostridia bacterium]|nr:hypothetical protein [Clostridia bacterium]
HVIDEESLYVVAINYNNKPAKANVSISPDYVISEVFGEGREGNIITLRENDGIILKLEKK